MVPYALFSALAAVTAALMPIGADGRPAELVPRYTAVDLGTLGGTTSGATAINKSGEVVGYAMLPGDTATHAVLWRRGEAVDLGTLPGGTNSRANAINDRGQVTGSSEALTVSASPSGSVVAPQAFLYDGGMVDIDPNARPQYSPFSAGYAINNAGDVVGDVLDAAGDSHVFRYAGGVFSWVAVDGFEPQGRGINRRGDIVGSTWFESTAPFVLTGGVQRSLGTEAGQAEAVNDRGDVVGWHWDPLTHRVRAFFVGGAGITELGTLGGGTSSAAAINRRGDVVGTAATSQGEQHAFLYRGGTMLDLNDRVDPGSGLVLEAATGINDSGEIVGTGTTAGGEHAFLLVPAR